MHMTQLKMAIGTNPSFWLTKDSQVTCMQKDLKRLINLTTRSAAECGCGFTFPLFHCVFDVRQALTRLPGR